MLPPMRKQSSPKRVPLYKQSAFTAPIRTLSVLMPHEAQARAFRIVSPMLPAFRAIGGDVSKIQAALRSPETAQVLVSDILSDIKRNVSVRVAHEMRGAFPRIKALVDFEKAAIMSVSDIESLIRKLPEGITVFDKLVQEAAFQFHTAIRKEVSKYFAGGLFPARAVLPRLARSRDLIEKAFSGLRDYDFRFVLDFTPIGTVNDFFAAFFGAVSGRERKSSPGFKAMRELKELQKQGVIPAKVKISAKHGIVQEYRVLGQTKFRSALNTMNPDVWEDVLKRHFIKALKKAWDLAVFDFFVRKPTSVSRWFPMRPMARKGLVDKVNSLMGMLLTGEPELALSPGRKISRYTEGSGVYGVFKGFDTSRAPYWLTVQYGFPGVIRPKRGRYLILRDPPHWGYVTWQLGQPVERFKIDTSIGMTELLPDQPRVVPLRHRPKGYTGQKFYIRTNQPVYWRTLMPSGYRFSAVMFRRGQVMPVVRKGVAVSFRVERGTYRLVKRVKGQRPSLYIERIIAMMSDPKYNNILKPAAFEAASAFLVFGQQAWGRAYSLMKGHIESAGRHGAL